jgi:hypothetical protein
MPRRITSFPLLLLVTSSLVATAPTSAAARPLGAKLGFHSPVTLPGSDGGNEPSLAISTSGMRYPSWQAPGEFASSANGIDFTNLGSPDEAAIGDVTNAVDAAGALYNGQICGDAQNILHTCVYRSLDGGNTWRKTQLADGHPGASDRPWIELYPHASDQAWNPDQTTVFLEYHTFSPEELAYVTVSIDGGATFSQAQMITTDTNAIAGSGCNTVPGGVVVDQTTGTAYALWLSGNDVESNLQTGCNYSQIGPFDKAWVSTGVPTIVPGQYMWTSHLAWEGTIDPVTKAGDNASKIFANIAIDQGGQVHVVLPVRHGDDPLGYVLACETDPNCREEPNQTDLLMTTSPDQGAHWTPPITVDGAAGSHFFPWAAAGSGGRVAVVEYTSSTLRPNDPGSIWYIGFLSISGAVAAVGLNDAHYVSTPKVQKVLLDASPVHVGGICTFGLFCAAMPNADRSLADSIAVAIDPAGGANAVWTDNDQGASLVRFACQSSGPSFYSGLPALKRCFGS